MGKCMNRAKIGKRLTNTTQAKGLAWFDWEDRVRSLLQTKLSTQQLNQPFTPEKKDASRKSTLSIWTSHVERPTDGGPSNFMNEAS